jgi:hypothetical protein
MATKKVVKRTVKKPSDSALEIARGLLEQIKSGRVQKEAIEERVKESQSTAITILSDIPDAAEVGVRFDHDGTEMAGFVQQNNPSEYWDEAALIQWLKENDLWMKCSLRMFDQARFEDLIQRGEIPAAKVRKFRIVGNAPAPFIRFGKPKKDSL